jgi:hypothetical protein
MLAAPRWGARSTEETMHRPRAVHALTLALGGLSAAACGSGSSDQAATAAPATLTPAPTPPGLPFHYEAQGQSSSPTFRVDRTGAYTVAYLLRGSADLPGCTVSIAMVADDGTAQPIVSGEKLQPSDTRQKSVPVNLKAGNWRFQEGGGCSWNVTVSPGGGGG